MKSKVRYMKHDRTRYGYYDEKGHWQRTKFCFMHCGDELCNCGPPNGIYQLGQPLITVTKGKK